jgi:hypothetical protein
MNCFVLLSVFVSWWRWIGFSAACQEPAVSDETSRETDRTKGSNIQKQLQ